MFMPGQNKGIEGVATATKVGFGRSIVKVRSA